MKSLAFLLLCVAFCECEGGTVDTNAIAPLPIKLPMPALAYGPGYDLRGDNVEPVPSKPPRYFGPLGVTNLALRKAVISSCRKPISGNLTQITDGLKEAFDEQVVEMLGGVHWIQVDLLHDSSIYAIVIWHDFRFPRAIYQGVVVQTADDSEFSKNVRTLFNNDDQNYAGLGVGKDKKYWETNYGKVIYANGVKARYVRIYGSGNNIDPNHIWERPTANRHPKSLNRYMEVEIYGFSSGT